MATLPRTHWRRLLAVHRSAGWPALDALETGLLADGLLEWVDGPQGQRHLRLTPQGLVALADGHRRNQRALGAHQQLADGVARQLLREGRWVWRELCLRAWVAGEGAAPTPAEPGWFGVDELAPTEQPPGQWRVVRPDVFSIRPSPVQAYLMPVVHEVKVSRADLLADLARPDKHRAYLDLGGACWYVLGRDARGRLVGTADEVPAACGVMGLDDAGTRLEVLRPAPQRPVAGLPHAVWLALARATPHTPDAEGATGLGASDGSTTGDGGQVPGPV